MPLPPAAPARAPDPTPLPNLPRLGPWLLLAMAVSAYVAFFHFPGTTDVSGSFLRWMGLVRTEGIAAAYIHVGPDTLYPPGIFIFSGLAQKILGPGWTDLEILKALLFAGALAGAIVYGRWSRSVAAAAGLLFATALSAIMLGYLDVLYLAPLLLALWALQAGRVTLASCCFTVALLIKWQPVILAPYFLLHAGNLSLATWKSPREWLPRVGRIALGAIAPLGGIALVVSPAAVAATFTSAVSTHIALSYQGLNPNWLIQLALYVARDSHAPRYFIVEAPHALQLAVCAVFWIVFTAVLAVFALRRRTFAEFVWFGVAGFFMYYLFNIGVHENHLFVCMTLAFVLAAVIPAAGRPLALYFAAMANLNLILFYGIHGERIMTEGIRGRGLLEGVGLTWATVLLALVNIVFGAALLVQIARRARRDLVARSAQG